MLAADGKTLIGLATLVITAGVAGSGSRADDVAPTAGDQAPVGVLDFRIVDEQGRPVAGRLTFVTDDDLEHDLFPNAGAKPEDLAVRKNVVYALSGAGRITVPIGAYTVYASRGLEWSIDSRRLAFEGNEALAWTARLDHEVDTTGWISGDFHLHTLTYSGHGDSNMNERIISIVAEGIEFAVATDHNHHTDYGPTMTNLGADGALTAVTGNEVSVPVGHFNAFPLDPGHPPVDSGLADANTLFRLLRGHPNAFDVVPVIQVNHPRWAGIDYFDIAGLDPVTGVPESPAWSDDFDTIEVLNENVGWGYYQAFVDGVETEANIQSVVRDWFNLLNRGHRYAAVGNSDSHTVHYAFAGYPRNFVRCSTDDAGRIDPVEIARALRERQVFTTVGPFVEFEVNATPMGASTSAVDGGVEIFVRVQAASWIDCDRVRVVVNGDVVETIDVPGTRDVLRLETRRTLRLDADAWITLLVEGDDPLDPIITEHGRPIRPLAVLNPVWVDADGDGAWTSPWEQTLVEVDRHASIEALEASLGAACGPARRGLLIGAAVARSRPFAGGLVRDGLANEHRLVRLCAARGAERLADASLASALETAALGAHDDPYLRVALLRALGGIDGKRMTRSLVAFLEREHKNMPSRYLREIAPMLPGAPVTDWLAIGYFPSSEEGTVIRTTIGPEIDPEVTRTFEGKGSRTARWTPARATDSGFLDLRGLAPDPELAQNAIACAQVWLHCPDGRDVPVALGTDDGSRVYLNGEIVYENPKRRGASPLEHVAAWRFEQGWNRVLFKVENGGGDFGVYFRVLDDEVTSATRPTEAR